MENFYLNQMTFEQENIVKAVQKHNLIVQAYAGSGKTTTILHIAKNYPNLKILILTYNKRLQNETKTKLEYLKITNSEIYTIHGFASKVFKKIINDDQKMIKSLENVTEITNFNYDLIIVDEAQDLNKEYLELISVISKKNCVQDYRIIFFGDKFQTIYQYLGSSSKFFLSADEIFKNNFSWKTMSLTTSFRLSQNISDFVNNYMFGKQLIVANPKVDSTINYQLVSIDDNESIASEIIKCAKKYGPQNVFVIAPSVRGLKSPIRNIANLVSEYSDFLIHISKKDDDELNEDEIKNKIVFCSFHQTKGLERDAVFLFNFDDSYFMYNNKGGDRKEFSNIYYVALTRAKKVLNIFHNDNYDFLDFLKNQDNLVKTFLPNLNLKAFKEIVLKDEAFDSYEKAVTQLIRNISPSLLFKIDKMIEKSVINETEDIIKANSKIALKTDKGTEYTENVSAISGQAVVLKYALENSIVKDSTLQNMQLFLENNILYLNSKLFLTMKAQLLRMKKTEEFSVNKILQIANNWNSCLSNSLSDYQQVDRSKYDWMEEEEISKIKPRIQNYLNEQSLFELPLETKFLKSHNEEIKVIGSIDCVDFNSHSIVEFKFVDEIKVEYFLQLIVYKWLILHCNDSDLETWFKPKQIQQLRDFQLCLHNLKDNQKILLHLTNEKIDEIFKIIVDASKQINEEQEFLEFQKIDLQNMKKIQKINSETEKHSLKNNLLISDNKPSLLDKSKRVLIIDFETFTNHNLSAFSLACILIENNQIIAKKRWMFKPYRTMSENENIYFYIHRTTAAEFNDLPQFDYYWNSDIKPNFFDQASVVVAHNVPFDITRILCALVYYYKLEINNFNYADSLYIFKKENNLLSASLDNIAKIVNKNFIHHDPEEDALMTNEGFKYFFGGTNDFFASQNAKKYLKDFKQKYNKRIEEGKII
ncbi:AAA family ATPase [[Mycoplasma] gypis]|uniref:AAA family ATPase n=1 Tax=[Mycoplasma] gypis TaxID=92404 RepID=A0ABZ2RN37_9BACT|nr:AAA family ATPase [[Mycoplasma] gypis]MBN0919135.1 AAA family ATPase [[Mycoplasma] gypis]